ncbi:MAG: hypothetical protein ACTSSP_02815 [Candidatus Asgardarchaeia archaeon]
MKLGKVQIVVGLIIGIITIGGTLFAIEKYFAKDAEVKEEVKVRVENDELINERVDMAISDDRVFQQQQHIQQMKNYQVFEQKKEPAPPTPMEKEALKQAEARLSELVIERQVKGKRYEERRMAK